MTYILEMLGNGLGNADFTNGDAKSLHEFDGIVVCTVGSTESRHRDTNDSLTFEAEFIECLNSYEKGKCRVKTSADTYHSRLSVDMIEAFGKSCHLDTENLLASRLHVTTLGNKGMGIDITCKHKVLWSNGLSRDIQSVSTSLGIDKRSVLATLSTELLDIYLTHTNLWLEGEALALDKEFSILEDHRISTIYHILS